MNKKIIINVLIAAGASVGIYAAFCRTVFEAVINNQNKIYQKVSNIVTKNMDIPSGDESDERIEWYKNQKFENIELINEDDNKLRGYFLKAEENSNVYVFFSHGYRSTAEGEYRRMAKFYHDKGFNLFLIDHQACGNSEGIYYGFGHTESRDAMKWLDYMIERFGNDIQVILEGVSMGSATVMLMNGDENLPENVKFTVADCGYTSVIEQFSYILKFAHIPSKPLLNDVNRINKRIAGYDFNDVSPIDAVRHAKKPILFIHGDADIFVPTYMASELYNACNSEYKDILIIPNAMHAQSYQIDSATYEEKASSYIDKFIV